MRGADGRTYSEHSRSPSYSRIELILRTKYCAFWSGRTGGAMVEIYSLSRFVTLDSSKLTLLQKTLKAARLAMTDRIVLNRTNTELLAANTRKNNELNVRELNTIFKGLAY